MQVLSIKDGESLRAWADRCAASIGREFDENADKIKWVSFRPVRPWSNDGDIAWCWIDGARMVFLSEKLPKKGRVYHQ